MPATSEQTRTSSEMNSVSDKKSSSRHPRLHFPGHRHHKSKEESKAADGSQGFSLRPTKSREESFSSIRRTVDHEGHAASRAALNPRAISPTPSLETSMNRDLAQQSPGGPGLSSKRGGFLDKFRRKEKSEKNGTEHLKDLPSSSSASLEKLHRPVKVQKIDALANGGKRKANSSLDNTMTGRGQAQGNANPTPKKEHGARIPFKGSKRSATHDPPAKDPNDAGAGGSTNEALFDLDTDLSHMEGIVNYQQAPMTPPVGDIYTGWPTENGLRDSKDQDPNAAWDAPDSWAVKKVGDENMGRLREIDEDGDLTKDEEHGSPYSVRIYRIDATFATLSAALNTTVAEIIGILGKRTFTQDEFDNYHIVMRKRDTSRQLEPGERPLVIQKRLLEQAGYVESDRIEDIGRCDNTYLCRFTFLPARLSGYSSLVSMSFDLELL